MRCPEKSHVDCPRKNGCSTVVGTKARGYTVTNNFLGFACWMLGKSSKNIDSQMVVNDGDESHGIPIRKWCQKLDWTPDFLLKHKMFTYTSVLPDSMKTLVFTENDASFLEECVWTFSIEMTFSIKVIKSMFPWHRGHDEWHQPKPCNITREIPPNYHTFAASLIPPKWVKKWSNVIHRKIWQCTNQTLEVGMVFLTPEKTNIQPKNNDDLLLFSLFPTWPMFRVSS